MDSPLVIFGCGYVGTRLARAALAQGRPVRACARGTARLEPLRELGAEVHYIDAARPKQFGPALQGLLSPTVVYSIPPPPDIPAGEAVRRASQAALNAGARSFIYLSTAGLYGNTADPDWVDEETNVALNDAQMAPRLSDESAVQSAAAAGLRTVILRLPAIYGPGRGVRYRLIKGDYKLIDGGEHWISRIHVDDLVRIILAADERAPAAALYLVSDDRPTLQKEHAEWLCQRLSLPQPPSVPAFGAGYARSPQRGRRIRNDRLKRDLQITLQYPSFIEGELQIEAEAAPAPAPPADSVPVPVPVPAPVPVPVEAAGWREVWAGAGDRLLLLRTTAAGFEIVDPQDGGKPVAALAVEEEARKRLTGDGFTLVGRIR
jgi:nucleoside-diphosphate-sugar epimerase